MTLDELTKLDEYGHKALKDLTEMQLNEYATLLKMRRAEVLGCILEFRSFSMRTAR